MSKEIELGELEFKSENFSLIPGVGGGIDLQSVCSEVAEQANHLLRERLASSQEVFFTYWSGKPGRLVTVPLMDSTHRARLVCIEEIK